MFSVTRISSGGTTKGLSCPKACQAPDVPRSSVRSGSASRQLGLDGPSAHAGPAGAELASQGLDPLAQSDQSATGAGQRCLGDRDVVVLDPHGQSARALIDADLD